MRWLMRLARYKTIRSDGCSSCPVEQTLNIHSINTIAMWYPAKTNIYPKESFVLIEFRVDRGIGMGDKRK